jgi:hypothetical protein
MAKQDFELEYWNRDDLRPTLAAYNPRTIRQRDLEALIEGIKTFGFVVPVVVNKTTGRMVSGHQRFKAAEVLELDKIPVHPIAVDEPTEIRLNLALNKIEGKWDYEKLEEALTQAGEADMLLLSGFSEDDLAAVLGGGEIGGDLEDGITPKSKGRTGDYLTFRSPKVSFRCPRQAYEDMTNRLHRAVGMDDDDATAEFSRIVGLSA